MLNPNEAPPGYIAVKDLSDWCLKCAFNVGREIPCKYFELFDPNAQTAPCCRAARADQTEVYFIKQPQTLERPSQMLHIVTSINQNAYIIDERTDGIFAIPVNQRWRLDMLDKDLIRQIRDHIFPQWCEEIQTVVSVYCELCTILNYKGNGELQVEGEAHGMRHCERDRGYPVAIWKTLADV